MNDEADILVVVVKISSFMKNGNTVKIMIVKWKIYVLFEVLKANSPKIYTLIEDIIIWNKIKNWSA